MTLKSVIDWKLAKKNDSETVRHRVEQIRHETEQVHVDMEPECLEIERVRREVTHWSPEWRYGILFDYTSGWNAGDRYCHIHRIRQIVLASSHHTSFFSIDENLTGSVVKQKNRCFLWSRVLPEYHFGQSHRVKDGRFCWVGFLLLKKQVCFSWLPPMFSKVHPDRNPDPSRARSGIERGWRIRQDTHVFEDLCRTRVTLI